MTFIKAFIYTSLLLATNFTMATQLFNPMAEYQSHKQAIHASQHTQQKTHKAQGGFPYLIPDNDSVGIYIPLDLTGAITGDLINLKLVMDIEHTFTADISATLISPNGLARLVLFSRVNSGANLAGEYVFSDDAINDLWVDSQNVSQVPEGEYRTSTAGFIGNGHGGCTTRMRGAFNGLTPDQSNGIWALHIADNAAHDTGQINDAYLIWSENSDSIFSSAFETITSAPYEPLLASDVLGTCQKAQFDFTGTGFSDYVTSFDFDGLNIQVVTNEGTPGVDIVFNTGLPFADSEMTSGGDFDGDGIKDFVFKTPLNDYAFQYLVRRSSRPSDLPVSVGIVTPPADITLDLQIGDYDGDGLDDFAFYVSNDVTAGLSGLSIIQSSDFSNQQIATITGITTDFKPAGGFDHNGDQIADLALMHKNQFGDFTLKVYDGSNGSLLFSLDENYAYYELIQILPGTFLADQLAGISIFQPISGNIFWAVDDDTYSYSIPLEGQNAIFGDFTNDIPITGDYDGDGIDDFGVWRPDTDSLGNRFIIRPSGSVDPDNNLIEVFPFNAYNSDTPLANIRVR